MYRTDGSEAKQVLLDGNSVSLRHAISTARTPEAHPPPPEGEKPANGTRNERRINHLASSYRDFIAHQTSIHITPGLVLAL